MPVPVSARERKRFHSFGARVFVLFSRLSPWKITLSSFKLLLRGYFKVKKKTYSKASSWCTWPSPKGWCKRMSTLLLQGVVKSRSKGFSAGGKALETRLRVVVSNALALITISTYHR